MFSSLARGPVRCRALTLLAAATVLVACGDAPAPDDDTGTGTGTGTADCAETADGPAEPGDLTDPASKDVAMQLVSSAENSSTDWRAQYGYLEDIGDGRGYTGGLIGFTSGTGDMLQLVRDVTAAAPDNPLAAFAPALESADGSDSHDGLGEPFEQAWQQAATDDRWRPAFESAQDDLRDSLYLDPAVQLAQDDGLPVLGQFAYYDAAVVHGPGDDPDSLGGIRAAALEEADTPAQGGDLRCWMDAFWTARIAVMEDEPAHADVSRITDLEERFADEGNWLLQPPLTWQVYGETFTVG